MPDQYFAFAYVEPSGGAHDCVGVASSLEQAQAMVEKDDAGHGHIAQVIGGELIVIAQFRRDIATSPTDQPPQEFVDRYGNLARLATVQIIETNYRRVPPGTPGSTEEETRFPMEIGFVKRTVRHEPYFFTLYYWEIDGEFYPMVTGGDDHA